MDVHRIDISQYSTEGNRLSFYIDRDGFDEAVQVAARIYKMYRLSLKHGIARNKLFRRSYILSCVDLRHFLQMYAPQVFKNTLLDIFYS